MIRTPTVFILGAGASMPYGYPSGEKLRDKIIEGLKTKNSSIFKELVSNQGFSEDEITDFKDNFFYSGKSSIDAFLEHRTEFIDIGKLVIAISLIPNENLRRLFTSGNGRWYRYFYNRLNTSFDDFDLNKISFITFNYDRSLEQFLFTALKNSYGKTDEECASKLKGIPIIHLHGKLDDLDWETDNGRPYQANRGYGSYLKQSADKIKIIHEDISEDKSFEDAHNLLEGAEKIHFLGFGYNKTNVKRLNIPDGKLIHGTARGMSSTEKTDASQLINGIGLHSDDVYQYMRSFVQFD